MISWSGTARRLALGFGALLLLFALAAGIALAGLGRIHEGMARMRDAEEGMRLALELSSAVRDQYAHQAHTIIIGDRSHLGFYAAAEARVLELTDRVRDHATGDDERAWVEDIRSASGELDAIFRQRIVPAVVRGDRQTVRLEHGQAQVVVTRIQERAAQLVAAFEAAIARARAGADAAERRILAWLVGLLLGAPLLAAAVSLSIGRSIAGPLAILRAGAARLAEGDLSVRIDEAGPDEFRALARRFNEMAAAIASHQARLVESEKLAGIGRLAAGVAHEINNPLGVILGYVRLLRRKAEGGLDADLAIVEEEGLRAKEIVDGLLELARPLPPERERVALRELCEEVLARLGEARVLEEVALRVSGAATADGHAGKLRQVVTNLVRNAAEAAGRGGRVELALAEEGGRATVEVRDDGPGVAAAARERLFEPFFTTRDRGTGLGLAISRAIARAHGGDVELAAGGASGGGACFRLTLPRSAGEGTR